LLNTRKRTAKKKKKRIKKGRKFNQAASLRGKAEGREKKRRDSKKQLREGKGIIGAGV